MVEIREAVAADVGSITTIYNATLETTTHEWTETLHTVGEVDRWRNDRQAGGFPFLVAVEGGEVVGWATYGDFRGAGRWPGYRLTVEHSVHVDHRHQGRGVGRALLGALADQARTAGKRVMVAGIDGANTGSVEFHARLGFVEVGRMPGIGEKWGQRLDLVLMQVEL